MKASNIPAVDRTDFESSRGRWEDVYTDFGYQGLAKQLMEDELSTLYKGKATFAKNGKDLHWTTKTMTDILESTYPRLLQSVILGNLALDRRSGKVLAAILDKLWQQAAHQPGIYHQLLVNNKGKSPSANQLLEVVKYMLGYVKGCGHAVAKDIKAANLHRVDDQLANEIENYKADRYKVPLQLTGRTIDPYHAYVWKDCYIERAIKPGEYEAKDMYRTPPQPLQPQASGKGKGKAKAASVPATQKTSTRVWRLVPDRITRTIAFANALRSRLMDIPQAQRDEPLIFPLVEVGYSKECHPRLVEHAAHRNSNYLMNLTEAIFAILHQRNEPQFLISYHINQTVIYLIYTPEQVEISEIGWTKLAEGYSLNGGGFSHYPAGLSNASANKTSVLIWSSAMMDAVTDSAMKLNCNAPIKRRQEEMQRDRETEDSLASEFEDLQLQSNEAREALFSICEGMEEKLKAAESGESPLSTDTQRLEAIKWAFKKLQASGIGGSEDVRSKIDELLATEKRLETVWPLDKHGQSLVDLLNDMRIIKGQADEEWEDCEGETESEDESALDEV